MRQGFGPAGDVGKAIDYARAFADHSLLDPKVLGGYDAQVEWEVREERLRIATKMMAALVPAMLHQTPHHIAERAVMLADALLAEVDG